MYCLGQICMEEGAAVILSASIGLELTLPQESYSRLLQSFLGAERHMYSVLRDL